jgi:hypothetical protein
LNESTFADSQTPGYFVMTRLLIAVLAVAAFPLGSRGEEAAVLLTVQPMPAPRPALKYQLLPELRELKPGNAAQNYLKCFMEQRLFLFNKEAAAERARYEVMPLGELPADKLRQYGGSIVRQADWAARLDAVDWQALERIQNGGMESLVDELGPLQALAGTLHVRFRAAVAARQFDDAIGAAKTMFALARHLGEHPTEVADLVGLWVAHLSLCTLEEMVQQHGCPNLYWALTDLPCPLLDLRKGMQGDRTLVAADLRSLRDDACMTDAELEKFVSHLSGVTGFAREQAGLPARSVRARLRARVGDVARVNAARQRLVEAGYGPDLIKTFPPTQVILVDEKREFEIRRDERMKLLAVPLWQVDSTTGGDERARETGGLFDDFLPHIVKLRSSQGKLTQQIAILRHVEAVRLYAAMCGSKLPAKLSDISVPLPVDPVTGQPFLYYVDGATAHIRGSSLPGEDNEPGYSVHYQVTVQK